MKTKPKDSVREAARKKAAWREFEEAAARKKQAEKEAESRERRAWADMAPKKPPPSDFAGIDRSVVTGEPWSERSRAAIAIGSIRQRIAELGQIRANYLRYQDDRVREHDHHGAWDVAINLAETEAEIAGLQFAEKALAS